ncbi:Sld5-domain-containing protein [Tilletiaria anomala UBC 951]|uniref:DNA replication complex GINS protein SLD5 n=1 Tax=Tilletiaria anomala (strain ATCC 24038 / CBS 436.72 / UBC 951) TaxID=1037660 RepID=A0A066VQB1_TILAU|nr:Sld5-domain-containing protein [Tilletiaria anomala UBC 951]KDN40974.1 Sld5-domain-containing protein [Tilletiaria anomala UBC 951]
MATRYAINSDDEDDDSQHPFAGRAAQRNAMATAEGAADPRVARSLSRMDEDIDDPYLFGIGLGSRGESSESGADREDVVLTPRRVAARATGSNVSDILSPSPRRRSNVEQRRIQRLDGEGGGGDGLLSPSRRGATVSIERQRRGWVAPMGDPDPLLDEILSDIRDGDRELDALGSRLGDPGTEAGYGRRAEPNSHGDYEDDEDDDLSAAGRGDRAYRFRSDAGLDTHAGRGSGMGNGGDGEGTRGADADEADRRKTLIEKLRDAWVTEKCCPELRPFDEEAHDGVIDQIGQQESILESLASDESTSEEEHFRLSLVTLDIERAKWLLRAYLRMRLGKIEEYSQYIANTASELRKLSELERAYVTRFEEMRVDHLEVSVLNALPPKLRGLEDVAIEACSSGDMVIKPDLEAPVFIRCKAACGNLFLLDGSHAELTKGSVHLLRYSTVRHLLDRGRIELM